MEPRRRRAALRDSDAHQDMLRLERPVWCVAVVESNATLALLMGEAPRPWFRDNLDAGRIQANRGRHSQPRNQLLAIGRGGVMR